MEKFKKIYFAGAVFLVSFVFSTAHSQELKQITLDDIIQGTFYPKSLSGVNWMKDGRYYTSQEYDRQSSAGRVVKYDISKGARVEVLFDGTDFKTNGNAFNFDGYALSSDETKILFITDEESVYRRSTIANFYLYDRTNKKLEKINDEEKISYATFSPDASRIAYVKNLDLYYRDVKTLKETRITTDGQRNTIINGAGDWVYEEEFMISKAFYWSPDSRKIAFYRFDESQVQEYNMQLWGPLYPEDYRFKYPKAGEANSTVSIRVYHLDSKKTVEINTETGSDDYIPKTMWTQDPNLLCVVKMNRLQNELQIVHANAESGASTTIMQENNETYVDINFNQEIIYLDNNGGFLRTSEQDGFKHLYLHDMDGSLIRQVTKGDWEIDQVYGYDPKKRFVYYSSTEKSPLERIIYKINVEGKMKTRLSPDNGSNRGNFSPDLKYFINYHSAASVPLMVTLHTTGSGKTVKMLEDNAALKQTVSEFAFGSTEFFSFTNSSGDTLNGYMIKPFNFEPSKRYPALMYVYGGPGSQNVLDDWGGMRDTWHHFLSQKGYIVACIDNRGTGGRGKKFKDEVYARLGDLETQDQIDGARHLGSLPFIDAARIGIWGWSYGGYMASLAILLGADEFSMAIAGAPVTSWRFYDTIYTERYLKTPQLNPAGYDDYSPLEHVLKLEDPYLLIHGTGDDNVHFQNTIEMTDALIAANKQFDLFIYPNRAHGFSDPAAAYHLYSLMTKFIEEKL